LSDDSISPISLVMIADMTFRSITLRTQHATIGEFAGRDAVADAEIILTNSSKQFRFGRVEIFESLKDRFAAMRFKDRRERHRARVVECAIFATPNSLKSQVARNLKSPFSNIRAVTLKLCSRSRPT
jgi:hypothetical protein